jgi:D-alanyl-lipoteichoic acid acyltransferase DltB (MBOAT superfamily)
MLFNSYAFIFAFLPLAIIGYFWLAARRTPHAGVLANLFLGAMSLIFYIWWKWTFVGVLLGALAVNFLIGNALLAAHKKGATTRMLLAAGVLANLALLGWFKYADFFVVNANALAGTNWSLLNIALPLGISFFTFTQIAFLVDASRGEVEELTPTNYLLFVTYFPHLLAGPIIHHREMMPQFADAALKRLDWENMARGLLLFALGLAKKVVLADQLAPWANAGFAAPASLGFADAWITMVSYSLQLAFDFSGYTDMALGAALMMNIRLPQNFNAPFRAVDIQEFWRRWHMTLSRFLRDYLYVPLGGNRGSTARRLAIVMLVFVLGGLWHGAAWTFVLWGAMHGAAYVVLFGWRRLGLALPTFASVACTFLFVVAAFTVFRAASVADALTIFCAAVGLGSGTTNAMPWTPLFHDAPAAWNLGTLAAPTLALLVALVIAFTRSTTADIAARLTLRPRVALVGGLGFAGTLMLVPGATEFIYFIF